MTDRQRIVAQHDKLNIPTFLLQPVICVHMTACNSSRADHGDLHQTTPYISLVSECADARQEPAPGVSLHHIDHLHHTERLLKWDKRGLYVT